MNIRPMRATDLDFAAVCTAQEGWASETRREFESFLAYDPEGCLVAEAEGQRIGICVASGYRHFNTPAAAQFEFGFVGELIVAGEWRGHGIGRRLLDHAVAYLRDAGAQSVFLDGVAAAVPLYERAGFRRVCRSLRLLGTLAGRSHARVRAMRPEDLGSVAELDQPAFGADRRFFLARRLAWYPELCQVLEEDGEVAGFIMGRRGPDWVSAGPWVVRPGVERPSDLLESLALEAGGAALIVGVLEANRAALAVLRALGLEEHPAPPWRMVLGTLELPGSPAQCYAIGSAAKG